MNEKTKAILSELKILYKDDPFDADNRVKIEFLCFVVDHYQQQMDEIKKELKR